MIDYDLAKKLKDIYQKVDDFDNKWLSAKGVFRLLHRAGAIDEEDLQAVNSEYDRLMAPINKVQDKVTGYVADHTMRFLWNHGIVQRKPGENDDQNS